MLARLPQLKFLDEMPVQTDERRCVTAWKQGGLEAERQERKKLKDEQLQWHKDYLEKNRDSIEKMKLKLQNRIQPREQRYRAPGDQGAMQQGNLQEIPELENPSQLQSGDNSEVAQSDVVNRSELDTYYTDSVNQSQCVG